LQVISFSQALFIVFVLVKMMTPALSPNSVQLAMMNV